MPNDDPRVESRRVDQQSIEIVGELNPSERDGFLAGSVVTSLVSQRAAGKSFALLKPEVISFRIDKRDQADIDEEQAVFDNIRAQADMFSKEVVSAYSPCPYAFKYRYRTDDGVREGTCQDWEMAATLYKWSRKYGEQKALSEMNRVFGDEYPEKGMLLAMGTHSLYPDTWLINGVVRQNEITQGTLL